MRILVCEDQKDLNKIITKHLTAEGYSADSCYDGQEALDFMDMADYDAVILDVMMPKKTVLPFSERCVQSKMRRLFCFSPPEILSKTGSGAWTWAETTI